MKAFYDRWYLFLMSACLICLPANTWGWYPYAEKYETWQKNRPILMCGWHDSVPEDHLPERIARFKAAGLNSFFWVKPSSGARRFFRAAHQAGLEWQLGIPRKSAALAGRPGDMKSINKVFEIPGGTALVIMDEPVARGSAEARQRVYDELKYRAAWARNNHPDLLVYANLSIGKIDLDRYVRSCRPDVFCFDYYPLRRDGTTATHYLHWVNLARNTARKHRLPYWMILQSYGRRAEKDETAAYAKRIPGEADMRFLVFSLLAHGGIGMHFFTYYAGQPIQWETMVMDTGVQGGSKVRRYENTVTSRAYHAIRDLAPEVQTLGRALLDLRPKGDVSYAGAVPDERLKPFQGRGRLRSVAMADDPRGPVLVGFFDDRKKEEYFMVVNLKHGTNLSKTDAAGTVRLTFNRSVEKIERLDRLTGLVEILKTRPGKQRGARVLDVQLEGGTGDLFKWSNGKPWSLRTPAP